MADSVFTPEQEARINDLLVEYLEQNGASIDAGINVIELTGDALSDENLKKLTIPSILPVTNQWAYTSLQNMMAPITHAISHLQTEDAAVQQAIADAGTATAGANTAASNANTKAGQAESAAQAAAAATAEAEHVNAGLQGMTVTITDRNGVSRSVDIGFDIWDTYGSIAEMNADAVNVPQGKFVIIATTDPTSTENAQMYVRNSSSAAQPFGFLCDLDQASSAAWADWLNNMKPAIQQATQDAEDAAALANLKAGEAETAANNANQKADYATTQGNYAKQKGDEASLVDADLDGTTVIIKSRTGAIKAKNVKGDKGDKGEGINWSTMSAAEKQQLYQYVADEIAQEGGYVLYPVTDADMTSGTFRKNSIITINGVTYKAIRDTTNLPVVFVMEDGKYVTQVDSGINLFVIAGYSQTADWEVWIDASNNYRFRQLESRVTRLETLIQ